MDRRMERQAGIVVNGRFVGHRVTGVQRYAREITARLGTGVEVITPRFRLRGLSGHAWEQGILPWYRTASLLWSPCGSGPILRQRQVVTIHDLAIMSHPEWFNAQYVSWYRWMLSRLVWNVRAVIVVSEFTKNELMERYGIGEGKVHVIPNGVTAPRSQPSKAEIGRSLARLGVGSRPYFLYVGSLEPRKNLARLLEAWKSSDLAKHAQLVLVGARGDRRVFAASGIHQIPKGVSEAGYVSDKELTLLYSGAHALVYPSLYEGFGLPVVEAMAVGTPVLTSNRTGTAEVGAGAAVLVDPYSIEEIADGLTRLWQDAKLRTELSRRGLERSRAFSWDDAARRTRKLLVEAAD